MKAALDRHAVFAFSWEGRRTWKPGPNMYSGCPLAKDSRALGRNSAWLKYSMSEPPPRTQKCFGAAKGSHWNSERFPSPALLALAASFPRDEPAQAVSSTDTTVCGNSACKAPASTCPNRGGIMSSPVHMGGVAKWGIMPVANTVCR